MLTITTTMPPGPPWIPSSPYRLTLEQYERMVDEGILNARDRVHLIDGYPGGQDDPERPPLHRRRSRRGRTPGHPPGRLVHPRGQADPAPRPRNSKPEPDRTVVRGTIRDYTAHSRNPGGIGLVVEVSDSTLYDDRALVGIYGLAGIPIYWIVNLVHRQVEVYSDPGREGYGSRQTYTEGQFVPVVIEGRPVGRIAVHDLLPAPAPRTEGNGA